MSLFSGEHSKGQTSWHRRIARILTWPNKMVVLDAHDPVSWWVPEGQGAPAVWWPVIGFSLFLIFAPVELMVKLLAWVF